MSEKPRFVIAKFPAPETKVGTFAGVTSPDGYRIHSFQIVSTEIYVMFELERSIVVPSELGLVPRRPPRD